MAILGTFCIGQKSLLHNVSTFSVRDTRTENNIVSTKEVLLYCIWYIYFFLLLNLTYEVAGGEQGDEGVVVSHCSDGADEEAERKIYIFRNLYFKQIFAYISRYILPSPS